MPPGAPFSPCAVELVFSSGYCVFKVNCCCVCRISGCLIDNTVTIHSKSSTALKFTVARAARRDTVVRREAMVGCCLRHQCGSTRLLDGLVLVRDCVFMHKTNIAISRQDTDSDAEKCLAIHVRYTL